MHRLSLIDTWASLSTADCFEQVSTNGKNIKTKDSLPSGLYPVVDQGQTTHFVYNYLVAMFYLKKTGKQVKRELKVFEISPTLRNSIKRYGLPMWGSFRADDSE